MVKGCHTTFTQNQFPLQLRPHQSIKFTDWESSLMDQEIYALLQKGVIEEANHSHGEFLSNVFLRPKKDGSFRMIKNLKNLNSHVEYNKLKMDTLQSIVKLGCVSLIKSKIGFLNLDNSENGFFVSLVNRLIQDHSDHGASKEPKNPLWTWILRFL